MAADETPLPAIIDIVINPKCSARKKWNTTSVRYTHANGLAGLKGMIERQLKEQLPKMQQNGEEIKPYCRRHFLKIFYFVLRYQVIKKLRLF